MPVDKKAWILLGYEITKTQFRIGNAPSCKQVLCDNGGNKFKFLFYKMNRRSEQMTNMQGQVVLVWSAQVVVEIDPVCLLLTPWSRVLEKLTGSQLVTKFPTIYETLRFMTAFTRDCHLSLLCARSIQSVPHHPTS